MAIEVKRVLKTRIDGCCAGGRIQFNISLYKGSNSRVAKKSPFLPRKHLSVYVNIILNIWATLSGFDTVRFSKFRKTGPDLGTTFVVIVRGPPSRPSGPHVGALHDPASGLST